MTEPAKTPGVASIIRRIAISLNGGVVSTVKPTDHQAVPPPFKQQPCLPEGGGLGNADFEYQSGSDLRARFSSVQLGGRRG